MIQMALCLLSSSKLSVFERSRADELVWGPTMWKSGKILSTSVYEDRELRWKRYVQKCNQIEANADRKATLFMDKFMEAASTVFPSTVIQHEDFYSEAAFDFLERYQDKYRMFNDDIQG